MAATTLISLSSIVQTFSVTNKWVFGVFCSVLLSREARPNVSATQVLPKDGGRERRDEFNMRHARNHRGAGPRLLHYGAART